MIKLIINKKEKLFTNREGLKILQKDNPKERFKIAQCRATGKQVIMQYDKGYTSSNGHNNWLCLHDYKRR
jgi:hypothetical protein